MSFVHKMIYTNQCRIILLVLLFSTLLLLYLQLHCSNYLQKTFQKKVRKINNLFIKIEDDGPGIDEKEYDNGLYIDKNISVNDTDFITLEPIKEINCIDLFVYKEKKNVKYLFKMSSLFDYLCVGNKVKNPYNI